MDAKDKLRMQKIGSTINNSKEKISEYNLLIGKEKDSTKR